ncbi:MAG TPA: hypothetical protein VD863_28395, partial [Bradyrhizobium sp.]|nr:hypothetical protein [Bradyrhizobium sp.]
MSAFGRRSGATGSGGGQRPSFGVARPMKGGGQAPAPNDGGDQFPPLDALSLGAEEPMLEPAPGDAMSRLTDRMNQTGEPGDSKAEGFEASIHRI